MNRKYQMTRIRTGDYLLPSNDARTLWRLVSYEEDGSAAISADGKNWRYLTGTHWQVLCFKRPLADLDHLPNDFLDWEQWEHWAGALDSRKAAIQEALSAGEVATQRER